MDFLNKTDLKNFKSIFTQQFCRFFWIEKRTKKRKVDQNQTNNSKDTVGNFLSNFWESFHAWLHTPFLNPGGITASIINAGQG